MSIFSRLLSGRAVSATTSRTATGNTTVVTSDLGNEIAFNSASSGSITIPDDATLKPDLDAVVYVYIVGVGIPDFVAGSGVTLRTPAGLALGVQYGYIAAKWVGPNEWAKV